MKRLENVRRDFVSNVSHELKTPITSIKGFVETLKDGAVNDTEAVKRFLDIIASHSDRLNSIIEDLLSLSRIEQIEDREKLDMQDVRIRQIINSAISLCQIKAKEKNIAVDVSCPAELTAKLNPQFIEHAVMNLLDNAIKYSDPNKLVKIDAYESNSNLYIKVSDQGQGIPNDHHARIFERFYRGDKARSRKQGGTGLGLAIVKHIVQSHGGSITLESEPGKGSVFCIELPRV
jgi:two-component system phosphate regulon sensor histidine kinase PhoR